MSEFDTPPVGNKVWPVADSNRRSGQWHEQFPFVLLNGLMGLQDKNTFTFRFAFRSWRTLRINMSVSSLGFEWLHTKSTLLLAALFIFLCLKGEEFHKWSKEREENLIDLSTTKLPVVNAINYLLCFRKTEVLPCIHGASVVGKFLVQTKGRGSPQEREVVTQERWKVAGF